MIRIEDFGEVAFGGAVTFTEWWDNKRIEDGKIASKDIFKKASFYTYVGIGLAATLMSVFGWMRQWTVWSEKVSAGFLYDVPRFAYNLTRTLSAQGRGRGSDSAAVKEASRIMAERRKTANLLAEGRESSRSYAEEFAHKAFAW